MSQQSSTMGVSNIRPTLKTDYQRDYLFEVKLPNIIGTTNVSDPSAVERLVQDITFGDYSMSQASILKVGALTSYYAGMLTIPPFYLTFLVPSPNILADYLTTWRSLIVNSQGIFSVKSAYQANIYVRFLDTAGNITGSYKCIGCFPVQQPVYMLRYGSGKVATVKIQFSMDKIEYTDLSTS